jgi:hypothetical protein
VLAATGCFATETDEYRRSCSSTPALAHGNPAYRYADNLGSLVRFAHSRCIKEEPARFVPV